MPADASRHTPRPGWADLHTRRFQLLLGTLLFVLLLHPYAQRLGNAWAVIFELHNEHEPVP